MGVPEVSRVHDFHLIGGLQTRGRIGPDMQAFLAAEELPLAFLCSDLVRKGFEDAILRYTQRDTAWRRALEGPSSQSKDALLPSDESRTGDLGFVPDGKSFHELQQQPKEMAGGKLHPYQLEGINFLRNSW